MSSYKDYKKRALKNPDVKAEYDALQNDKFGEGIPLYHIERKITEMDNALFGDGAHIIYVNGEYRNAEHLVESLMYDFNCKKAKDIVNPLLAEEVRELVKKEIA